MNAVELQCVVKDDITKHYGPGEMYYPVGGGALRPDPENTQARFNVRTLTLQADNAPTGDLAAAQWMLSSGLALIGYTGQAPSFAGKRFKITIEELPEAE